MHKVRALTGTVLTEQPSDTSLRKGQWRIDEDPAGGTTGHVEILTEGKGQAVHIQATLANVAVAIQQDIIPLQVTGDSLVAGTFRRD